MAGKSFPWNSEVGNERYFDATDFSTVFSAMYSDGVFYMEGEGNLKVETNSGMTIKVKPGISNLNGIFYYDKSDKILTITPVSSSSQSRIDNVVIKYNEDDKESEILVVEGTAGTSPIPPSKNSNEFVIAQIKVRGAATSIISSDITDTRGDSNLCGFVTSTRPELPNNIVEALEAAMDNKLDKSGGTVTGDVYFTDGTVSTNSRFYFGKVPRVDVGDAPNVINSRDLTTKNYVDNRIFAVTELVPIPTANTPISKSITHDLGVSPVVTTSYVSSNPNVLSVCVGSLSSTSFNVIVNRSNTTDTVVHLIATKPRS